MTAIQQAAEDDFLDVEGLRQAIIDMRKEAFLDVGALLFMAGCLETALSHQPIYDPSTGVPAPDRQSAKAAKATARYIIRSAEAISGAAAQLAGAWAKFDKEFLRPAEEASGQRTQRKPSNQFKGIPTPGSGRTTRRAS